MQICRHTSDNHPPVILQIYQTIFDAAVMSTSVLSKDNTSVSTVLLFTASSNMSLAERVYFTILIPVTLVILITIMAYYTVTEMKISSQLKSELNKQEDSKNSSVVGYEECSKKLEVTKQGVEKSKMEMNEDQKKKKEVEEQLKKCKDGEALFDKNKLVI